MQTTRTRILIQNTTRPVLRGHVHMHYNELREAHAVLAPEHVYWPDDISVAILKKLDGVRDVATIIDELASDYAAPVDAVGADIREFLQTWADERLITEVLS
ncbi:MAG: pyrroloquinoline quinone biosynthesis peptide chaperone PqqD [Hyphomicrobiales bacterium]